MNASEVSSLLYKNLNFRSERQKIISTNIANINTPNYKTKDITFEQQMQITKNKNDLQMVTTHHNHIPFEIEGNKPFHQPQVYEVANLEEQNDGNNVNLDHQISEMSKNAVMYDAITNSIKKDTKWFISMIDSSSKN